MSNVTIVKRPSNFDLKGDTQITYNSYYTVFS